MTPVALWTGRLPGLRPLPRKATLWAVGGIALLGTAGAFGAFGACGPYVAIAASLASGWTAWRHRWPTGLPLRLRSLEPPQGPDERAVMVEIRKDGDLLGWDVGILWFEKAGVGFVGRTVSFVLPRASMQPAPGPTSLQTLLRPPQLTAKVFETTIGIVPLGKELKSQTTLARIDALPGGAALETILPPPTMHPELIQRGIAVRRRASLLAFYALVPNGAIWLQTGGVLGDGDVAALAKMITMLFVVGLITHGKPLPKSVDDRLPLK